MSSEIRELEVAAYTLPTDAPEQDGTLDWDATTLVAVHAYGGGQTGFGYTYGHVAAAPLIYDKLRDAVRAVPTEAIPLAWSRMVRCVRNSGVPGVAALAISAVDNALWDLKCKLLGVSLVSLLGPVRDEIPVYGSGGFTSYEDARLREQLVGWAAQGIRQVKMKVGRDAREDVRRVRVARDAVGPEVSLFVDANGGYSRKQALAQAEIFAREFGVTWFEEPRPSDDLEGLRLLRDRGPAGMDIAAGEYGYMPAYFRAMLSAGAVDCLQADVTRCLGVTGFCQAAALCEAFSVPLSAHCCPALHAALGCALRPMRHIEYFHDHVRLEAKLLDGIPTLRNGALKPDPQRPGFGFELKRADAERFKVWG